MLVKPTESNYSGFKILWQSIESFLFAESTTAVENSTWHWKIAKYDKNRELKMDKGHQKITPISAHITPILAIKCPPPLPNPYLWSVEFYISHKGCPEIFILFLGNS